MRPDAEAQIRSRVRMKVNLKQLTHEQAVYAVLDRALLWAERENSLWRTRALKGWVAAALIGVGGSVALAALGLPWWAVPLPATLSLIALCWVLGRRVLALADEARQARILRTVQSAIEANEPAAPTAPPPAPPPVPPGPNPLNVVPANLRPRPNPPPVAP